MSETFENYVERKFKRLRPHRLDLLEMVWDHQQKKVEKALDELHLEQTAIAKQSQEMRNLKGTIEILERGLNGEVQRGRRTKKCGQKRIKAHLNNALK